MLAQKRRSSGKEIQHAYRLGATTPCTTRIQIDQFTAALNNPGGLTASGLTAAQFTALTALNTSLKAASLAKVAAEGAYRAAVDTENAAAASAETALRAMGMTATNFTLMTDVLRNEATLTVRDTTPSPGILPLVEDLAVVGRPNGNNQLNWGSVPGSRGVIWEVEASAGSSGNWVVLGGTSKRSYLHVGAGAGVHRLYRIVARRGDVRGEPGNEAAVYSG